MLPTFHWAYSAAVPRYDFDPARARALAIAGRLEDEELLGRISREAAPEDRFSS